MLNTKKNKIFRIVDKSYPDLSSANLKWIQYDSSNNSLYIGTNLKGLYSFDIAKLQFKRIDGKDENDDLKIVNVIAKEKDKLFLSTDIGIFVHYINTGENVQLCKPKSIRYTHIINDNRENLWVCGSNVELYDVNTLKQKCKYSLEKNGVSIRPMRIFISRDNEVFALTYGNGIMKLDKRDNTFKDFPEKETPLHNEYCYQIIQTLHNDFVTIGDKGINILDRNGDIVNSYQLGKYIPINSFVRDSGLLSASDGTIFIGGIN